MAVSVIITIMILKNVYLFQEIGRKLQRRLTVKTTLNNIDGDADGRTIIATETHQPVVSVVFKTLTTVTLN